MVPKGPIPSTTAPNESPRSPPPAPVCLCACGPLQLWFRVPPKVYFKGGCLETALGDLKGKERAFIVTGGWACHDLCSQPLDLQLHSRLFAPCSGAAACARCAGCAEPGLH